ncbi:hypothetical protein MLD38_010387 [Melastoma candidum]|uniref:Uncharacterized protein n=1 Tax=Melastoma candidum TaxID=119954 RepID=A0ACB9R372_9MYRT|nr:hypothetical protein MLD38_010387 [Melastoma candidum]
MKASAAAWLIPAFGLALVASAASTKVLVEEACLKANYKELCVSTIGSDPEAPSSDLPGLAMIALRLGAADASSTSAFILQSLNDTTLDPTVQQCLADCSDYYLDAVQQLDNCVAALTVKALGDAREWIETAIEDVSVCEQGFKQHASVNPTMLSARNEMFRKLADNALTVVNALH